MGIWLFEKTGESGVRKILGERSGRKCPLSFYTPLTIRYSVEVAEYFPALCLTAMINDAVMKSLLNGIIVSN